MYLVVVLSLVCQWWMVVVLDEQHDELYRRRGDCLSVGSTGSALAVPKGGAGGWSSLTSKDEFRLRLRPKVSTSIMSRSSGGSVWVMSS